MISQGWKKQRRTEAEAPLQIKRVSIGAGGASRREWVDSMLGLGSSKTLRMRVVGAEPEAAVAHKSKGYLRLALSGLALIAVVSHFKPWRAAQSITMPELVQVHAEKKPEAEPKTALIDAGGTPIALWRSETGNWYGINARAELSRMSEKEADSRLNLPRLEGAALHSVEKHGGHVMELGVDPDQLADLLPLRPDLAAEIDVVQVAGKGIRLRTHGGSIADLGEGDYKKKEARLAAVLADLGARKKRASSVDLRFENSAVVRLASR